MSKINKTPKIYVPMSREELEWLLPHLSRTVPTSLDSSVATEIDYQTYQHGNQLQETLSVALGGKEFTTDDSVIDSTAKHLREIADDIDAGNGKDIIYTYANNGNTSIAYSNLTETGTAYTLLGMATHLAATISDDITTSTR